MSDILIKVAAVVVPALIGVGLGTALGFRHVRLLRDKTGDTSLLTTILSGAFLQSHKL